MNARELYSRTLGLERFRILQQDLLPLTVGHVRLMEATDCMGARDPGELGLALAICSRRPADALEFITSPGAKSVIQKWGQSVGVWDWEEKRNDWSDYLRVNTEIPDGVLQHGVNPKASNVPSSQTLRVRLMSELHVPHRDVDDYSILQALWDLLALDNYRGLIDVLDMSGQEIAAVRDSINWEAVRAKGAEVLEPKA